MLQNLPDCFRPDKGDELPVGIIGSTIRNMGTIPNKDLIEGGGLVIDYVPAGSSDSKRVVLGFNELAMWIEFAN